MADELCILKKILPRRTVYINLKTPVWLISVKSKSLYFFTFPFVDPTFIGWI